MRRDLARNLLLPGLSLLLLAGFFGAAQAGAELVTVEGKIVAITLEPPAPLKGSLEIEKQSGGREIVHVGFKTRYEPSRAPVIGDQVTAQCVLVNERLAARLIRFNN